MTFEGEECWLDGLVDALDIGAERARLTKLLADRKRAVSGYLGKLSNAGYMAKAPPNVVQETQKMLLDALAEVETVERSLRELA